MPLTNTLMAATAALALALPATASGYATKTGGADVAIFASPYALAAGDVNGGADMYVRTGGTTRLLTSGAADMPAFHRASKDASVAYFKYGDKFFVRTPTEYKAVPATNAELMGVTPDGARAYLQSVDPLAPGDDDDNLVDVFEYTPQTGAMRLLSTGTPSDGAFFQFADPSGSMVYFETSGKVTPDDKDDQWDVFVTDGSVTVRVSPGNGTGWFDASALGSANDRLVFRTNEALVPADTDAEVDLYATTGNAPTLLTPSPNAASAAKPIGFVAASATDAHRVLFKTDEKLSPADTDTTSDLYASEAGKVTLLTAGVSQFKIEAVSDDAETVLFSTVSKMLPSDTDLSVDMYTNGDGGPVHLLKTNQPVDQLPESGRLSPDGKLAAFETAEPVAPADTDAHSDVYAVRDGGAVHFASAPGPGAAGDERYASPAYVLSSGEVVFNTSERLLGEDRNTATDAYGFLDGKLTLISADTFAPDTRMATAAAGGGAFSSTLATDEISTFECRVDGGAWTACFDPWAVGPLPGGEHALEARAVDMAGNADPSPAKAAVTVPAGPGGPSVTTDAAAPSVSAARLRIRRRVPTLSYTLSEAATVRVQVQRRAGRRWRTLRARTLAGRAGANRTALAKVPRGAAIRVVVKAVDAAGNAAPKLVLRPSRR